MKLAQIGRLSTAIAISLFAAPIAFSTECGVLGIETAFHEHLFWTYPGALTGLV